MSSLAMSARGLPWKKGFTCGDGSPLEVRVPNQKKVYFLGNEIYIRQD